MGTELRGGHKDSVLYVAASNGRLLSGGEQGELCIWSLDGAEPKKLKVGDGEDDVTSICCSVQRPHEIYAACGQSVFQFDTRQLNEPVHTYSYNEDEINQVILNEKESHLAACDDSGHIKVINIQDRRLFKTLRKHTNICSALTFRPKRHWDLISGGLDCLLLQWDYSKAKNYCNINMQEIGDVGEGSQDSYLVNPPFIHSLAVSSDGCLLACGTENALVQIFDSSKRTLEFRRTLRYHTQGVCQVQFIQPQEGAAGNGDGANALETSLLLSAGNDGKIVVWDVCDPQTEPVGAAVATVSSETQQRPLVNGHSKPNSAAIEVSRQYFKAEINHSQKINWIASCVHNGQTMIAVADNSSNISLYPLPQ